MSSRMATLLPLVWWGAACAAVTVLALAWGCAAMAGTLDERGAGPAVPVSKRY